MCHHHSNWKKQHYGPVSEKMKFYHHLRTYLIFNFVITMLMLTGSGGFGMWKASLIWGIFVGVHYLRIFGWPGTNGWFGEDWEDWMEEREGRRSEDAPEPLEQKRRGKGWREKDLV